MAWTYESDCKCRWPSLPVEGRGHQHRPPHFGHYNICPHQISVPYRHKLCCLPVLTDCLCRSSSEQRIPSHCWHCCVVPRTLDQKDGLLHLVQKLREATTDAMPVSGFTTKAQGGCPNVLTLCSSFSRTGFPLPQDDVFVPAITWFSDSTIRHPQQPC